MRNTRNILDRFRATIQNVFVLIGIMTTGLVAQVTIGPYTFYPNPASMSAMGVATVDGSAPGSGAIIAAFDQNGICSGATVLTVNAGTAYINLPIYGDDSTTPEDDGVSPGETFTLQIYDNGSYADNATAYDCWANESGATHAGCLSDWAAEVAFASSGSTDDWPTYANPYPDDDGVAWDAYQDGFYAPNPSSMTFMGIALINGGNAESGDIIAAFDENGVASGASELTINAGTAYINMPIYGNDSTTPEDDGVDPGENFYIVLYDASENMTITYMQAFDCWANESGATHDGCGSDFMAQFDFTGACGDDQVWCGEAGPTNEPPVANDQAYTCMEDDSRSLTLTASDDGLIQPLTYEVTGGPSNGTLTYEGAGGSPGYNYAPDPDYFGPDTFTFSVYDGEFSDEGTISFTVYAVNDAPALTSIEDQTTPEEVVLTIPVHASDIDDGDILNITATSDSPGDVSVEVVDMETVTDVNGNVYETIQVGDQLWMKENLKVTHYNDGTEIPTGYSGSDWANLSTGAYTAWGGDESNADTYGYLYNWFAVETGNLAPEGWHVATNNEYYELAASMGDGPGVAGKLKECTEGSCPESEYWNSPNLGATNESGFTGLPGGHRSGQSGNYSSMNTIGMFWTSTGGGPSNAWTMLLWSNGEDSNQGVYYKKRGCSVRCVKDEIRDETVVANVVLTPSENFNGSVNINVTVSDGSLSDSETFVLTVTHVNDAPTADAGTDQGPYTASHENNYEVSVDLDGSGSSDIDGTIASYSWTENGNEIATGASASVSLGVGVHNITLTVTDNEEATDSDDMTVTINQEANYAPTANAGEDQSISLEPGDSDPQVTLDGSGSSDVDGTIASYSWSEGADEIATGVGPTVTLSPGLHEITLTVTDDDGATDSDAMLVNVIVTGQHWFEPDPPGAFYHNIFIGDVSVSSTVLEAGVDEIGIFDGDILVGSAFYSGTPGQAIQAWADNEMTPGIDGYTSGNAISIRYWDASLGTELPVPSGSLGYVDGEEVDIEWLEFNGWNTSGNFNNSDVSGVNLSFNRNPFFTSSPVLDVDEDSFYSYSITTDDFDLAYADAMAISYTSGPDWLSLADAGDGTATLSGTPPQDYNGDNDITLDVVDLAGAGDTQTYTLTVNPINDNPEANDDVASGDEDNDISGDVSENDSDLDATNGDHTPGTHFALHYAVDADGGPSNGSVTMADDGSYTYSPNQHWNGTDSFTYTVSDEAGGSDGATVTITVNPINDDPEAGDDVASGDEDNDISGDVSENDSDLDATNGDATPAEHHALHYAVDADGGPSNGSVSMADDGSYTYTPNGDWNGTDSFTYTVSDEAGGSDGATVTITVNPINDNPDAADDTASGDEDNDISGDVSENDSDLDATNGDATPGEHHSLHYAVNGDDLPSNGSVVMADDGTYTYIPDQHWNGTDSFAYTVSDEAGGSDVAGVTITVAPINDDPVADDSAIETFEDTDVDGVVTGSDLDADNGDDTPVEHYSLHFAVEDDAASHGSVAMADDGSYTYSPDLDYNTPEHGPASFTFRVSDEAGGYAIGTVDVTVNPGNDPPVLDIIGDQVTDEDTDMTIDISASDLDDGNVLSFSCTSDDEALILCSTTDGDGAGGGASLSFDVQLNNNGYAEICVTIDDGEPINSSDSECFTLTVNAINDAPIADDHANGGDEDNDVLGTATGSDIDASTGNITPASHHALHFAITAGTSNGSADMADNGSYTYSPNLDYHGADAFVFTLSDEAGGSDDGDVYLTVNPVNDNPILGDIGAQSMDEDGGTTGHPGDGVSINVDLSSTDVDHGTHNPGDENVPTYTVASDNASVSASIAGTALTLSSGSHYNGSASITVTVTDDGGLDAAETFTLTINAVDDPLYLGLFPGDEYLVIYDDGVNNDTYSDVASIYDADGDQISWSDDLPGWISTESSFSSSGILEDTDGDGVSDGTTLLTLSGAPTEEHIVPVPDGDVSLTFSDGVESSDNGDWNITVRLRYFYDLDADWSWRGFPVIPVEPEAAADFFGDVLGDVFTVKSYDGSLVGLPGGGWGDGIGAMDSQDGYVLGMHNDASVTTDGQRISADAAMALSDGWSWLDFYGSDGTDAEAAFGGILGDLIVAMSYDGALAQTPWGLLNGIGDMSYTDGYIIKVSAGGSFVWGSGSRSQALTAINVKPTRNSVHFDDFTRTQHYELISINWEGSESILEFGNEIAVFSGDLCVGSTVYEGRDLMQLIAWEATANDPESGFTPGEEIRFVLFDGENEIDLENVEFVQFSGWDNSGTFVSQGLTGVEMTTTSLGTNDDLLLPLPTVLALEKNYPNPFNPVTMIKYDLPNDALVSMTIYSILGEEVRTLVTGTMNAGWHSIAWNGKNNSQQVLPSGVYIYQMVIDGAIFDTRKMLLVK